MRILSDTVLKVRPSNIESGYCIFSETRFASGSYTPNFYDTLFTVLILLLSHQVFHLQMALRSQFVILFKHN